MSNGSRRKRNKKVRLLAQQDGLCWLCGMRLSVDASTIDHLIPVAHGGSNNWSNYRLAHWMCNQIRGDVPADQAQAHVQVRLQPTLHRILRREFAVMQRRQSDNVAIQ